MKTPTTKAPAVRLIVSPEALEAARHVPVAAALLEAQLTIGMVQSGGWGDADPRVLLDNAIQSLWAARAMM
jgi:hypothetical protein